MGNTFAVINLDRNMVVAEATHYQEAARICDRMDAEYMCDHVPVPCVRLPHTVCRIDSLHLHEREFGRLK